MQLSSNEKRARFLHKYPVASRSQAGRKLVAFNALGRINALQKTDQMRTGKISPTSSRVYSANEIVQNITKIKNVDGRWIPRRKVPDLAENQNGSNVYS